MGSLGTEMGVSGRMWVSQGGKAWTQAVGEEADVQDTFTGTWIPRQKGQTVW